MPRRSSALGIALLLASCGSAPLGPARSPRLVKTVLAKLPATYRKGSVAVSDDGTRCAFVVQASDGQQVVTGSTAGPVFKECSTPRFAPKSDRLLWLSLSWARYVACLTLTPIARPLSKISSTPRSSSAR